MNKITNQQFLDKANKIHNNKFKYLTEYVNSSTLIKIECPKGCVFEQLPAGHFSCKDCPSCSGRYKKTLEKFVDQANIVHKNKYGYKYSMYVNSKTALEIDCYTHGIFKQIAGNHLGGQGCPKCRDEQNGKNRRLSNEEFLLRSNTKHKFKYIYPETYINANTKIRITCRVHGDFLQNAKSHMTGRGCIDCANEARNLAYKKDLSLFKSQANKVHNGRYDYSEVVYKNTNTKIKIICEEHGYFYQIPLHHLHGSNCPICVRSNISLSEVAWLNSLNNTSLIRQHRIVSNGRFFNVDAYDPTSNTIYEFHGDYWHGNLKVKKSGDLNKKVKLTFGELYLNTIKREILLKRAGYKVVSIWESEWKLLNETTFI